MLQTIQSPILAFKPPNLQDIRNNKTKEQMIKKTRGTRSKEQDDLGNKKKNKKKGARLKPPVPNFSL